MKIKERNLSSGFCTFIEICRAFDFLKSEGYITSEFFTGRDVYVVYKNPRINQTITISLPEPNEKTLMRWKWQIIINKKVFLFTKTISITDCLELPANLNLTEQLIAYSQFIRENFVSIVRGEKWKQIDRCQYQGLRDNQVKCNDINDLSEEEKLFWEIYNVFSFLCIEGYHSSEFNIGKMVSLTFVNYRLKQDVTVSVSSLSCECDIVIEKKNARLKQSISVKDIIDKYEWHKNTCSLISYSDFIQQNLMPVIRGEKWE